MVGWHHRLDGHESEQAPGVGDGRGGLVCCSPWGHKESDMTERLNWTEVSTEVNTYLEQNIAHFIQQHRRMNTNLSQERQMCNLIQH